MKKSILLTTMLFCISATNRAQFFDDSFSINGDFVNYFEGAVLRDFAYNNESTLCFFDEGLVSVYDDNINKIASFTLPYTKDGSTQIKITTLKYDTAAETWVEKTYNESMWYMGEQPMELIFWDLDNANACHDVSCTFTQTLFNNDEAYECIYPIYEKTNRVYNYDNDNDGKIDEIVTSDGLEVVGFKVLSDDGAPLYNIRFDVDGSFSPRDFGGCLLRINGKMYICWSFSSTPDVYNRDLTLFYRINKDANSIKSVAQIPSLPVKHYSIDGRQFNTPQRGINITRNSDGSVRKVLVR